MNYDLKAEGRDVRTRGRMNCGLRIEYARVMAGPPGVRFTTSGCPRDQLYKQSQFLPGTREWARAAGAGGPPESHRATSPRCPASGNKPNLHPGRGIGGASRDPKRDSSRLGARSTLRVGAIAPNKPNSARPAGGLGPWEGQVCETKPIWLAAPGSVVQTNPIWASPGGVRRPILRNKANSASRHGLSRTKCAKQSQTWANWGIWGTGVEQANPAKQSQFGGMRVEPFGVPRLRGSDWSFPPEGGPGPRKRGTPNITPDRRGSLRGRRRACSRSRSPNEAPCRAAGSGRDGS